MTFAYILCGWEGLAHGSSVYNDAKGKGLPLLNNKFYLGDAGSIYLGKYVLRPFRGVRNSR